MDAYKDSVFNRHVRLLEGWRLPFLVLLVIGLAGCATTPATKQLPNRGYQNQLGKVAIVAKDQIPELNFEEFVDGKWVGAAKGAGGTFASCMSGSGGCSGDFCGAALLIMLGVCGIAGVVGGGAGAVTAPSADYVKENEAALTKTFEVRAIQSALRNAVIDAALDLGIDMASLPDDILREAAEKHNYRSLANHGVNTVLEVALTKAGSVNKTSVTPAMSYMWSHIRVIDVESNTEKFATDYVRHGRRLNFAGQSGEQVKSAVDELDKGYRTLGTHIIENVFQIYPFPDREGHSAGGHLIWAYGLAPIYPPIKGAALAFTDNQKYSAVESLRPRFRWESFPRASDIAVAPQEMARVNNVRYDLIIANEENMAPAEIVYRQNNLAMPEHMISISLEPETRYFWAVRARFDLDGRKWVTEWSSTSASGKLTSPSSRSFRFKTP